MSENLNPIVLEVEEVRVVNAVSPTVDLGRTETGALVTVHDYRGTQTVEILDGPVGPVGPQGPQGESGAETAKAIVEEAISRMEDSIHDAQMIGQTVAGYRDAAAQSASNAALSKDAAALSAQAAEQSNQSSSGYARTAGEQAENAAQSAQAASQSATAADTSSRNAAQSETNAGNSASAASQSAQAASQSATNAAQSEQNAADSAQDAHDVLDSIPEDYSQMSADVADLQTSVADLDDRKANIDGYYPDMTVGNAEQLNSSKYVENSEPYTLRTSGGSSDIGNREYVDAVVGGTLAWNQMVRDEASENSTDFADVVTVTDAVEDAAGVKVKIEPVQDLNGYDHPWPAGGGKNLAYLEQGSLAFDTTGAETPSTNRLRTNYIPIQDATRYIASFTGDSLVIKNGCKYDANKQYIGYSSFPASDGNFLSNDSNAKYVRFIYGKSDNTDVTPDGYKYQFELGTTATSYTPYSNICPISGWDGVQIVVSPTTDAEDGQTYDITLPTEAGTVYGGELTVNADGSGSLVVDTVKAIADGTIAPTAVTDAHTAQFGSKFPLAVGYSLSETALKCNRLKPSNYSSAIDNLIFFPNVTIVTMKVSAEVTDWVSWLSNNPVEFSYKIANPQTYTLTASQIRTLLGTNNVWADTGDLALTYTGTDEHLTLESGKKYLARISGTDSMLLGSGQEITAAKGTDNVFDLTKMFGTAVADYVYGQGAAFFRKWFGKTWYPYNAGELKHVEGLQSHDMVGFNQWDEEWELGYYNMQTGEPTAATNQFRTKNFIPVVPNATYYFCSPATVQVIWFDANKEYVGCLTWFSGTATMPNNVHYIKVNFGNSYGTTYKHDICISLAHNNSRNGEYEPYEKHSYPLDSTVVLRGIPKVGADGVYWDGDRYLPDGTVERRYGVVDLGTLEWKYSNLQVGKERFETTLNIKGSSEVIPNVVTKLYTPYTFNWIYSTSQDKGIGVYGSYGTVVIRDTDYTDAATFKAAMQGVLLVYELATPTTETAQPYHSTQWVSDWGTEEFVSTGLVPVGHETRYPANLRDKLQHLPDAASGNGSYLITQTDGQMVLTPFPAPPSSAGNYVLKATVTGGVATYTWEVAT